jgi:hypothetical protein
VEAESEKRPIESCELSLGSGYTSTYHKDQPQTILHRPPDTIAIFLKAILLVVRFALDEGFLHQGIDWRCGGESECRECRSE